MCTGMIGFTYEIEGFIECLMTKGLDWQVVSYLDQNRAHVIVIHKLFLYAYLGHNPHAQLCMYLRNISSFMQNM